MENDDKNVSSNQNLVDEPQILREKSEIVSFYWVVVFCYNL